MNKSRMEAFSDGVFAIAITILILELRIPIVDSGQIFQAAMAQLPKLISFVLSFIIIGIYWIMHNNMVRPLKKISRAALWLNLLVLLFVCFIPYSTGLLGQYPFNQFAIILYLVNLSFVNIAGTFFWLYTSTLKDNISGVSAKVRRNGVILTLMPVVFYFVSILFTFWNMAVSYIIVAIVPILYIFSSKTISYLLE